ncbi:hypothetical protein pipiens_010589 [Culex pipiens pipiens]|uniref:BTB domain-containing protein n=1 Tax=Culex pipiens pipiens TaxID=38569 RepID=A0ABD1D9L7_CULPP
MKLIFISEENKFATMPKIHSNSIVSEEVMTTSVRSNEISFTWVIHNFSAWLAQVKGNQMSFKFPSGRDDQWYLQIDPDLLKDRTYCGVICLQKRAIKPDGTLLIKCTITSNAVILNEWRQGSFRQLLEPRPSSLSTDLKTLFEGDQLSDVTVLIQGQRILAHKCILSARSSVFAAMFHHQLKESIENCVTIDDVEPDVFNEMLRYIYTDELTGLDKMANKLYTVADKYALETMKSRCRYHILEKLNLETAAETLVLADLHADPELKQHALEFLCESVTAEVLNTKGWKQMAQTHPNLVEETVRALLVAKTSATSTEE